jgi:hypothetical protein
MAVSNAGDWTRETIAFAHLDSDRLRTSYETCDDFLSI